MNKIKNYLIILLFTLLTLNLSFSQTDCIDYQVIPIKDSVSIKKGYKNFVEFKIRLINRCNQSFSNLSLFYDGYIFYPLVTPTKFSLEKNGEKEIDIKIYAPDYISSGWKGINLKLTNEKRDILNSILLTFYIDNPNYRVVKEVKYIYLKLSNNLDLLIEGPQMVKTSCEKDKKVYFYIIIKNLNLDELNDTDINLLVIARDKEGLNLPLEWNLISKDEISKYVVEKKDNIIKLKNSFIADYNVNPGIYTIKALLTVRQDKKLDLSEQSIYNTFVEGTPCFNVSYDYDKGLFSTLKLIKITNYGNKEGVFIYREPVNWFKKMFMEYNFEGKLENNVLETSLKLDPKESKILKIKYDYTSLVIFILIILIFGGIVYYLNYIKPFSFKKDLVKIQLSKNGKYFTIEVNIKNNSFKKFEDVIIVEKITNGEVEELSVYPKADKIKNNISGSSIRWEFKEIKPQQKIKLQYKIKTNKSKGTVVSQPTYLKIKDKIYTGKGLKIILSDNIRFEEFEI